MCGSSSAKKVLHQGRSLLQYTGTQKSLALECLKYGKYLAVQPLENVEPGESNEGNLSEGDQKDGPDDGVSAKECNHIE